jgi:hypothetical protein
MFSRFPTENNKHIFFLQFPVFPISFGFHIEELHFLYILNETKPSITISPVGYLLFKSRFLSDSGSYKTPVNLHLHLSKMSHSNGRDPAANQLLDFAKKVEVTIVAPL